MRSREGETEGERGRGREERGERKGVPVKERMHGPPQDS